MKNLPMPAKANDPKRQVQFIEFFMIQGSPIVTTILAGYQSPASFIVHFSQFQRP